MKVFITTLVVLITAEFHLLISVNKATNRFVQRSVLATLGLDVVSLMALTVLNIFGAFVVEPVNMLYVAMIALYWLFVLFVSVTVILISKQLDDQFPLVANTLIGEEITIGSLEQVPIVENGLNGNNDSGPPRGKAAETIAEAVADGVGSR